MLCSVYITSVNLSKWVDNHFDLCCRVYSSTESIKGEMHYVNFPVSLIACLLCQGPKGMSLKKNLAVKNLSPSAASQAKKWY